MPGSAVGSTSTAPGSSTPAGRFCPPPSSVGGDLTCRGDFEADGEPQLSDARKGGSLDLSGATLYHPGQPVLNLEAVSTARLVLLPGPNAGRRRGPHHAKVGAFEGAIATWPDTLRMRGFVYENLVNDGVDVSDRLRWLTRHPEGYVPQLYDQLAASYRGAGQEGPPARSRSPSSAHVAACSIPLGDCSTFCCT